MTQRDFQAIARAIYQSRLLVGLPFGESDEDQQWTAVRDAVADVLAASNPRFDRARFVRRARREGSDMDYNGWTNYETWAVALWIDNDEDSYRERQELARQFERDEDDPDSEADVAGYADAIKEWVERDMVPDLGASLASDLLGAALSEVNWREIAESWLEHD